MITLNRIFIAGYLTRDPESRNTQSGIPVTKFPVAVNRFKKNPEGDGTPEADFFDVIVWNNLAVNCGKFLSKGRPVLVEGHLQNRQFEIEGGKKRFVTEIMGERVSFLHPPEKKEAGSPSTEGGAPPEF